MPRQPWTCPKCGRALTVRNQEHVCGLYDLDSHFERKDPIGRVAFDWMRDVFEALGPVDVLPMKTTIAFARGVNVAFLTTRRRGAEVSVVLTGTETSPRFTANVPYSRTKTIYRVRVAEAGDLDEELGAWLRKAFVLGRGDL